MYVDQMHVDMMARRCWDQSRQRAAAVWPQRVSRFYAGLIDPADPDDPLLRQVLPDGRECRSRVGYRADPLDENSCQLAPGVLAKYPGRILVLCDGSCALRCRFCFRRHHRPSCGHDEDRWLAAVIGVIGTQPECREVILSGGDPLGMPQNRLCRLLAACDAVPQIVRIRLHTRYPVADPARVDAGLVASLAGLRAMAVMVLHINHPREVSPELVVAAQRLRQAGVQLYAQSVLLRGVNDDLDTLLALGEALAGAGIVAYYLHQLDRVSGAAHFAVSDRRARALHAAWRAHSSGYMVPRLVRDLPGHPAKVLL